MYKVLVFQQNASGKSKIEGIRQFGKDRFDVSTYDIDVPLPPVIDDTTPYLPDIIEADIVLDFLTHRDLSDDLSSLCHRLDIPVVASGKKITTGKAICPPVCCALARQGCLGKYGESFGAPEIEVDLDRENIREIRVVRGAPCGATWHAAEKIKNRHVKEAVTRFGLEVQFCCTADPANWDPLWGKSPVHVAADIHSAVLKVALKKKNKPGDAR